MDGPECEATSKQKQQDGTLSRGVVDDPVKIGAVGNPKAKVVRIVHISDTHLRHNEFLQTIPPGDILIHSGDFSHLHWSRFVFRERDFLHEVREINAFFAKLPHQHKIFVAGNHELNFLREPADRTHSLLTNAIYLQDSFVVIKGIKIYGSPWNGLRASSHARGFTVPYHKLGKYWEQIPEDTDVVVTHQPPLNILDLGMNNALSKRLYCDVCSTYHTKLMHFGCPMLKDTVMHKVK